MNNYKIVSTHSIEVLHRRANDLIDLGYIPAGGITQVPYRFAFYISSQNTVRYSDTTSDMRIQFIQSFYKPQVNSI